MIKVIQNFLKKKENKMKSHKQGTAHFEELTFKEQASSITATINALSGMIRNHLRRANIENRNVVGIHKKRFDQIKRMIHRNDGVR